MPTKLVSPYLTSGFEWLRGNLHTHTTNSDGSRSPDETVRAYVEAGYDFLCISDHDTLTWPVPAPAPFVLIPGVELGLGPHILAVNVETCPEPCEDRQAAIDCILQAGGMVILNHPNWGHDFNHFPHELMERLTGYAGIEIYNGVVDVLEGSPLATDRWDRLLSVGRTVWGFAHDDLHHERLLGRGWIVAQAKERTREGIMEALSNGSFYSSTGVDIRRITVGPDSISVQAPKAQRIRFIGVHGRLLHEADDCEAGYRTGGREGGYVRIECLGRGGRCAWSQPIRVITQPDGDEATA